jgi:precorrin-6Y C5,15-methyltransferase (decarboxylating)
MTGIWIVGVGPGNPDYLTRAAREVVDGCQVLIGGARNLALFSGWSGKRIEIADNIDSICNYLETNSVMERIGVLVTGDPGLFSMAWIIRTRLPDCQVEIIPGVSSLQYMAAKLKIPWHDWRIISLHGKNESRLLTELRRHPKVCVFTGGKYTPAMICRDLVRQGFSGARVWVGEKLSYPQERIVAGSLSDLSERDFDSLALMLIEVPEFSSPKWPFQTPGISDGLFIRGDAVPMTKEEVRAVSLAKLRLMAGHTVYDIGAGTGSVAVECALRCREGTVFAVEQDHRAGAVIAQNAALFGTSNLQVVAGTAPEVLIGLPEPDRVFIGGTGGKLLPVLGHLVWSSRPLRVVINAVTLETCHEALTGLAKYGFGPIDVVNLSFAQGKLVGDKHLMRALNPVYVISATRGES